MSFANILKSRRFLLALTVCLLLIWQINNYRFYISSTSERPVDTETERPRALPTLPGGWFEKALLGKKACVTNRTSFGVDLKGQKLILFWTPCFSCDYYGLPEGGNSLMDHERFASCPHRQCYFQYDRRDFDRSDAIVFHARDMENRGSAPPEYRRQNQLWAFLTLEPQPYTEVNLRPFDSIFNLSMTFRRDSHIHTPYARVVSLNGTKGLQPLPKVPVANRSALAAWTVSNCDKASSQRNLVVQELQKYMRVDIYGKCGNFSCPDRGNQLGCYEQQTRKYKFYLSFENSLCEDYVTEKFFNALYVGMVPVVYGYGDYSQIAPNGSYIDVTSFGTLKELADYLLHLDKHPEEYQKYLDWRKDYTVLLGAYANAWCQLCTFLWTSATSTASGSRNISNGKGPWIIENLSKWWYSHSGKKPAAGMPQSQKACIEPKDWAWWQGAFA